MSIRAMALVCAAVSVLLAWWCSVQYEALPDASEALLDLEIAPEQQSIRMSPFEKTAGGVTYTVTPVFSYALQGLVVSRYDTGSWWSLRHKLSGDFINTTDLCVVWGRNAQQGLYQNFTFENTEFFCMWRGAGEFVPEDLSNNHLLADSPEIAKKLASVHKGDQIRIRGYLVNYYKNKWGPGSSRNSSITRTDTGDGACEIVYVTDVEILKPANVIWRRMYYFAWGVLLASLLVLGYLYYFTHQDDESWGDEGEGAERTDNKEVQS